MEVPRDRVRAGAQVNARPVAAPQLWTTIPKGSSKMQTDLTRDKGWEILNGLDLK